jgi:hypothetical protein
MILVIRNWYVFETVTDTSMKQLEKSMEIDKTYLKMFGIYSISYFASVDATL